MNAECCDCFIHRDGVSLGRGCAWTRCVTFASDGGCCGDQAFVPTTFVFVFRVCVLCMQDALETPFTALDLPWDGDGLYGSSAFCDRGSLLDTPPIVPSVNLHWCARGDGWDRPNVRLLGGIGWGSRPVSHS